MKDTGQGDDVEQVLAQSRQYNGQALCGRGIAILSQLISNLHYFGNDNLLEACYLWK